MQGMPAQPISNERLWVFPFRSRGFYHSCVLKMRALIREKVPQRDQG